MATLKERLDAACEGRPVYQLTPEEQAWLEADRAAIEAGDREFFTLAEMEAEHERLLELETSDEKPEGPPRDRRVPPHR